MLSFELYSYFLTAVVFSFVLIVLFFPLVLFCLQNHQSLSSLPPLPEGGDVDERAVVTDDSQEASIPQSESAETEKSAGSSDKDSESVQPSDSAHSISPPPAASPDKRKRKRNVDEEIPARPSFPYQLPKNLPPKNKKTSTPSLLLATSARKSIFTFQLS